MNAFAVEIDDALEYLPRRDVKTLPKMIERLEYPLAPGLHLMVRGRLSLYHDDFLLGFFGKDDLIYELKSTTAVPMENMQYMSWPVQEVEQLIEKTPRLGIVMIALMAKRESQYVERLRTMSRYAVPQRLALTLLCFAAKMGQAKRDGTVHIPPISQNAIASYIGTSRELVTSHMSQLRRQGLVQYSRSEGLTLNTRALREHVRPVDKDA